jgi:hypothetical protein
MRPMPTSMWLLLPSLPGAHAGAGRYSGHRQPLLYQVGSCTAAVATDGEANLCSCSRARGHGPGQGSHGVTNRSFGQSSAGKRATGVWGRPGDQTHRWALALVKSAMRLRPKGVAGLGYGRVDGHPMDERSSLRCTGIARRLHVVF